MLNPRPSAEQRPLERPLLCSHSMASPTGHQGLVLMLDQDLATQQEGQPRLSWEKWTCQVWDGQTTVRGNWVPNHLFCGTLNQSLCLSLRALCACRVTPQPRDTVGRKSQHAAHAPGHSGRGFWESFCLLGLRRGSWTQGLPATAWDEGDLIQDKVSSMRTARACCRGGLPGAARQEEAHSQPLPGSWAAPIARVCKVDLRTVGPREATALHRRWRQGLGSMSWVQHPSSPHLPEPRHTRDTDCLGSRP